METMGSSGVERTRPVNVTAAPAPSAASRKALVSAPGSKSSDCRVTAISAPGHRREKSDSMRAGQRGFVVNEFIVQGGADELPVGSSQCEALIAIGQPIDEF